VLDSYRIKVKIADVVIGESPVILTTYGLGSCVAVMVYDPVAKVGGMNHFLLPHASPAKKNDNQAKFSDTGISMLIEKVEELGARKERLVAKIAGGANMFPSLTKNAIGQKNIDAALKVLKEQGIRVLSSDIGGNWGRSVDFDLSNGMVTVRSYRAGVKEI
jgi:chemotaxis protein CheD